MNGPARVIRLELARRPVIYTDALTDAENARLNDWIAAHYDYLHLVDTATELAEGMAA
jgi:hypothetical protein